MKLLNLFLIALLAPSLVFGNITSSNEYLLDRLNSAAYKAQLGNLVNRTKNLLVAKYSYAVQGGTTNSAIRLLRDLSKPTSYATLPDNAVLTNVWVDVLTKPTTLGSGSVNLQAMVPQDLLATVTAANFPGVYAQGIPAGTTTTFVKMSNESTVKLNISGTNGLSAGKLNVYIEYVLSD